MLAQALAAVVGTVFDLVILAALVRFWMQAMRAPARNPIAQFSMAITDFAVKPLRRVIPGLFRLDLASLLVAWILELVLQVILRMIFGPSPFQVPAMFPVLVFLSFVMLVRLSIYVFMGAVIIQAVLSWVAPHHPVMPFFDALARPLLNPVRRVIPPIGGMDISPLFVFLFLQVLLLLPVAWLEQEAGLLLQQALL
ncbi:MAG TPA: YggT family protein [Usitatibacter sp.]|nr:YggT family protein [Usitatibacter sp.]